MVAERPARAGAGRAEVDRAGAAAGRRRRLVPVLAAERVRGGGAAGGAEWLVVGAAFESAAADPTAAAEQEMAARQHAAGDRRARACGARPPEGRASVPGGRESGGSAAIDAAIAAVQPRCILALGRLAARALLERRCAARRCASRCTSCGAHAAGGDLRPAYLLRHAADKAARLGPTSAAAVAAIS